MAIAFLGKLVFCSYFSKPRKKLYSTGAMTLSVMTLNIKGLFATFSIMALSTTTVVIVLNTVMLSVAFFFIVTQNVIMLSVAFFVMLNVIILNIVVLNVIVLNVVAP
jgi:hypothetical protein